MKVKFGFRVPIAAKNTGTIFHPAGKGKGSYKRKSKHSKKMELIF